MRIAIRVMNTISYLIKEILQAWFETPYSEDAWNLAQIERVCRQENRLYQG